MRRGFLSVSGRRVHYRVAGSGPPVVMLHGSPGDSAMFSSEMAAFAEDFTAIALDTPGFGFSDPLPGEVLRVADLAQATAEAMAALGLPACAVYGSHTGAAIGLELGVGWPERVSGLLLEGVPLFTGAETEAIFRGYFAPMVADPLGGHLTSTWMRFRDQFTWFPWCSRDVTRLNPLDRPTPEDIHHWVSMFYRSCRTYGPAYRAACYYGEAAGYAAAALTVPAVYTASATDMLHPHLDRLPRLRAGQRIAPLADGAAERCSGLLGYLRSLPNGAATEVRPAAGPVGSDPALCFVAMRDGDVLVRCYGDRSRPAVLLAHDAPGTGLGCETLVRTLAADFYVLVPDLPGCGESSAPAEERAVLAAAADALTKVAAWFGLERYAVAGLGCGAAVAATLAGLHDPGLVGVVLHLVPVPDAATASAIAPDILLSAEGAHWVRAWLMLRDAEIYRPWFAGTVAAQRREQGNFDAQWLHEQTCALMAGRASYHLLPRAAWRFDTLAAVRDATVPVQVVPDGAGDGAIEACLRSLHVGLCGQVEQKTGIGPSKSPVRK
jgi:pimeloyl-ACP methyl ester carboxylesterase